MPRALWSSWGGGAVSYERGTPVRMRSYDASNADLSETHCAPRVMLHARCKEFYQKVGPESSRDCHMCATLARQREGVARTSLFDFTWFPCRIPSVATYEKYPPSHRALGIGLLQGATVGGVLMSEVPLYLWRTSVSGYSAPEGQEASHRDT